MDVQTSWCNESDDKGGYYGKSNKLARQSGTLKSSINHSDPENPPS